MKKLLFVLAFTFIGQQAFSQIVIVTLLDAYHMPSAGCILNTEHVLVKVDPTGNQTTVCIPRTVETGGLIPLTQEINNIISQGYQLIETNFTLDSDGGSGGLVYDGILNNEGVTFIFAIP